MEFIAGRTYKILSWDRLKEVGKYNEEFGWIEFKDSSVVFLSTMKPLCGSIISVEHTCKTARKFCDGGYTIHPVMCEDVTDSVEEQRRYRDSSNTKHNTITTTIEVFDIPDDMLGCAFWVDHDDTQEAMLLYDTSTSALFFKTIDGDKFVCTFAEYKSGNVIIRPMVVSDIIL